MDAAARIVGSYRLVSMEHIARDGEVGRPFGDDPSGFILYTPEHCMTALLMRSDRPNIAGGDILAVPPAEAAAAFATASAFGGRWRVEGEELVHELEAATFPNWVGTKQRRRFEVSDARLTLFPPEMMMEGKLRRARVEFERIRA